MKALRFCIEGCGRETGAYSGTGRKNPLWCPECDEKRIRRIEKQMTDILEDMKNWDRTYNDPNTVIGVDYAKQEDDDPIGKGEERNGTDW